MFNRSHRGGTSLLLLLVSSLTISLALAQSAVLGAANVLIYSATGGYRHDSIPIAIEALESRSASYNIRFETTEDFTWFREQNLRKYDAIVFLSTTGEGRFSRQLLISWVTKADALHSSRLGGEGRISKVPEQRWKFRRDPLCE
jgi:hypothetical protein